ncbi:CYTH domain-containing protein [Flammeovirgaceae bacterium SG7u.111]|nr:CYTH domain-containing protein [Flammeovirgaceae bacterium SG7u.132]WPO38106.1 CYTH domain-containing protein [Flammeovirgaceae bacterium SG7u.111]
MPTEIERKFVIETIPSELKAEKGIEIRQSYIAIEPMGKEVRLRQSGEKYFLTVKSSGALVRSEYEISLSQVQYESLLPSACSGVICKTRYWALGNGKEISVDIFHEQLAGLVIAEVEFSSIEDSVEFEPPSWFGREVTDDPSYKNKYLAQDGIPTLD